MTDIYSKEKRSIIMSKIAGKETKPETIIRKYLFSKGFRYRKNLKDLPGKPDIVLSKYKTIIFIHGCFWHHHKGCKYSKLPETRKDFWNNKISNNIERDKSNINKLKKLGWNIFIIWQCEIRKKETMYKKIDYLVGQLKSLHI